MKNVTIERIIETQEESEEDNETTFTLFADEKIVCWAKTLFYGCLEEIHTARKDKRKGFGQKLLSYLENNDKEHGATTMKAGYEACCNNEASGFFRSMGYGLKPTKNSTLRFFRSPKTLGNPLPVNFNKVDSSSLMDVHLLLN